MVFLAFSRHLSPMGVRALPILPLEEATRVGMPAQQLGRNLQVLGAAARVLAAERAAEQAGRDQQVPPLKKSRIENPQS